MVVVAAEVGGNQPEGEWSGETGMSHRYFVPSFHRVFMGCSSPTPTAWLWLSWALGSVISVSMK